MWIDVCCMSCGGSILVNHTGGGIQIILDAYLFNISNLCQDTSRV